MVHIFVALIPVFIIGLLFYYFDQNKEPVLVVLRAFVFGIFSVGIFIMIHLIFPKSLVGLSPLYDELERAFYTAAFKEEAAKLLAFLWAVYRHQTFDEWYDGILYGIMVGLGFAFVENLFYFFDATSDLFALYLGRSVLSMPLHALLGGIMGYFVGKAKFVSQRNLKGFLIALSFFLPFLVHGSFDFVLLCYDVQLAWFAVPIVIFLWGWVLRLKRQAQQHPTPLS